jgi:hypothetical protein
VLIFLGNTGVRIVLLFIPGSTNLKLIYETYIASKLRSTLVGLVLNCPTVGMSVLPLRVQQSETLLIRVTGCSQKRIWSIIFEELFVSRKCMEVPYHMTSIKSVFVNISYVYMYTGCPRRNVPNFGRVFLMLKYTDITQNTYIQSWTVTAIMAKAKWGFLAVPRTVPLKPTRFPYTAHVRPWEWNAVNAATTM